MTNDEIGSNSRPKISRKLLLLVIIVVYGLLFGLGFMAGNISMCSRSGGQILNNRCVGINVVDSCQDLVTGRYYTIPVNYTKDVI